MTMNIERSMSSAQLRKIRKPLVERKRRERINDSLEQLKALLLREMNKDESQFAKIEKADILELAVEHLKTRAHVRTAAPSTTEVVRKYSEGFSHCIQEVNRCMTLTPETAKPQIHQRLMHHLSSYLVSVPQNALTNSQMMASAPRIPDLNPAQRSVEPSFSGSGSVPPLRVPAHYPHVAVDQNNNVQSVQNLNHSGSNPGSRTTSRGSRESTPVLPPSHQIPDHFFNPIRVQVDGLEALTPISDLDSSSSSSPVSRRLEDVMAHQQQHGNILSVKQAWIEQVHEERKKAVSDDVWRPW